MPIIECIKSVEDREFPTDLGNWTGDFAWTPSEFCGPPGYMGLFRPPPLGTYSGQLTYPAVEAPPEKLLTLHYIMFNDYYTSNLQSWSVTISDGVYTFGGNFIFYPVFTTPADWNKLNTKIEIEIVNGPWDTTNLCWDDFTLWYEEVPAAKTDHLPLMGVH